MSEVLGPVAVVVLAVLALGYFAQSRLPPPKPVIIGIDLGTTFSCAAVYYAISGNVNVVEDELGNKLLPSSVYLGIHGKQVVGYDSFKHQGENPEHVIYDAKRFIGKKNLNEATIERQQKLYPFKIKLFKGSAQFGININGNVSYYEPEDIGSFILTKLKRATEKKIGREINMAVISVPAEFDSLQRNATIEAGKRAGLNVIRVINEPTAAAMAYGLHKNKGVSNVLVVDFGGGTLDVSLLSIQGGMFYTMAMAGNNRLGGQDVNQNVYDYIVKLIKETHGFQVEDISHQQQIRTEVENIKINLTYSPAAIVDMKFKSPAGSGSIFKVNFTLSRETFEKINQQLFEKVLVPIKRVLKEVEMNENEIDEIVLVGGSTRIPKVRKIIQKYFNKEPNVGIDPELAVVTGVAIQAGILGGGWPLKVAAVELPTSNIQKIEIGDQI